MTIFLISTVVIGALLGIWAIIDAIRTDNKIFKDYNRFIKEYPYGTRIIITKGFYSGSLASMYKADYIGGCNVFAKLDSTGETIKVYLDGVKKI
jgi:hypothetical protein